MSDSDQTAGVTCPSCQQGATTLPATDDVVHCEWCGMEYPVPASHRVAPPSHGHPAEPIDGETGGPGGPPLVYEIEGHSTGHGHAQIHSKGLPITIDTTPGVGDEHPGPAELLAGAFAGCLLKNVERFGQRLSFHHRGGWVTVRAQRQESPPRFTSVTYTLHVRTDEAPARVDLLHRNLQKHGTIFNTLAAVCEVSGEIVAQPLHAHRGD
jgi:uncharacterized OsmC-like protein